MTMIIALRMVFIDRKLPLPQRIALSRITAFGSGRSESPL